VIAAKITDKVCAAFEHYGNGHKQPLIIDDRILYDGDSIRGFNVRQIGDRTVSLESDGVERDPSPIYLK
jgi:hypothetical protein